MGAEFHELNSPVHLNIQLLSNSVGQKAFDIDDVAGFGELDQYAKGIPTDYDVVLKVGDLRRRVTASERRRTTLSGVISDLVGDRGSEQVQVTADITTPRTGAARGC